MLLQILLLLIVNFNKLSCIGFNYDLVNVLLKGHDLNLYFNSYYNDDSNINNFYYNNSSIIPSKKSYLFCSLLLFSERAQTNTGGIFGHFSSKLLINETIFDSLMLNFYSSLVKTETNAIFFHDLPKENQFWIDKYIVNQNENNNFEIKFLYINYTQLFSRLYSQLSIIFNFPLVTSIDFTVYQNYDLRFFIYFDHIIHNYYSYDRILLTDISDVKILKNPFKTMITSYSSIDIFVCSDKSINNFWWLNNRFKACKLNVALNDYHSKWAFNAGIIGGKLGSILWILYNMVSFSIKYQILGLRKCLLLAHDMVSLNHILYVYNPKQYNYTVMQGPPFIAPYWQDFNDNSDRANTLENNYCLRHK